MYNQASIYNGDGVAEKVEQLSSNIAPNYTKKTYEANSYVMQDGVLYTNPNAIETAEDWNPAHWTQTTIPEVIDDKIDEVTLDPSAVALGNVHLLDEVTSFAADAKILVDSETNGPGAMSAEDLLELTAQNAYDYAVNNGLAIAEISLDVGSRNNGSAFSTVRPLDPTKTSYRSAQIPGVVGTTIFIKAAVAGASNVLWATYDKNNNYVRRAEANINAYDNPISVTLQSGEVGFILNTAYSDSQHRWFGIVDVAKNNSALCESILGTKDAVSELSDGVEHLDDVVEAISTEVLTPTEESVTKTFTNTKTSAIFYPNYYADATRASTITFEVCPETNLRFDCGTDYDIVVFSSSSPTEVADWQDSGWKTGGSTVEVKNRYVSILVRTSSTNPLGLGAVIDATALANLSCCDIVCSPYSSTYVPKGIEDVARTEKVSSVAENPYRFGKFYYYHVMTSGDAAVIPSQSLYDVDVAQRLGFKVFEANIMKVADGYLMHHGQTAKTFANNTVTDLLGNYANGVDVSGMTLTQIAANYRYKAKYPKQRTSVAELEAGLSEMKRRGMIPFFSFNVAAADEYRHIVKEFFGNDYIAYQGNPSKDATMIMMWSSLSTKSSILDFCKTQKLPYLHMPTTSTIADWILSNCKAWAEDDTISNAKTYFNSLTESQQKELIRYQIAWFRDLAKSVHKLGCLIGWAANYSDAETNQLLAMSDWDCAASGGDVNDFENGNIVDVSADLNFDDFTHSDSTESDGVLTVPATKYVYASGTIPSCFLGKVAMHIRYDGTLKFTIPGRGNFTLVNDGTRDMYISSLILDSSPQIWIQAQTDTNIYDLTFKSSKC